ncbi:hypothetical protein [Peptostreptococcus sp.]|uniref:hypothetical protein n=1 Tax=Peptostreptococcus sp. TaxID=1262 RepID=UPI002FCADA83
MSYLLEIYSTHNMWKKRITHTLSSIDNNFSIMVPKENNEIVIFSNDCVGKMLLNKMDFFEKYYPISSEYNFIDWIMLSVNCELKDITKLSIYDLGVFRAICRIYELGNNMMTYKMILHELTGVKSKSPRKNQIDDIKNSIEKMSLIDITVCLSKKNIFCADKKEIIKEKLIYNISKSGEFFINGNYSQTSGIKLFRYPLLYRMLDDYYKINRLSSKIIEVPISSTRTNIEVKEYLLYKIENSKYKKNKKDRISFEEIYKDLEVKVSSQKRKTRNAIMSILNYWVEVRYIKSFNTIKNKNRYMEITIEL